MIKSSFLTAAAPQATMVTGLFSAAAVLAADQRSKAVLLDALQNPPRSLTVIPGFFNLTPVWNRGVTFGLFPADSGTGAWFLIVFALAVTMMVSYWLYKASTRIQALCYGAIIGGAVGNVIDRVRFRAVFDFLDFYVGAWHYPAFNIADSGIVCGVAGLLLFAARSGKQKT